MAKKITAEIYVYRTLVFGAIKHVDTDFKCEIIGETIKLRVNPLINTLINKYEKDMDVLQIGSELEYSIVGHVITAEYKTEGLALKMAKEIKDLIERANSPLPEIDTKTNIITIM